MTGKWVPKATRLTTEKWKIGYMENINAPVGFAKNPTKPLNSLGMLRLIYYSNIQ